MPPVYPPGKIQVNVPAPNILSPEQALLTTLVVQLAVMAALATMLVRYPRFRHILILVLFFGVSLAAGIGGRATSCRRGSTRPSSGASIAPTS